MQIEIRNKEWGIMNASSTDKKSLRTSAVRYLSFLIPYSLFIIPALAFADDYTPQSAAQKLCEGNSCPFNTPEGIFTILQKIIQYVYLAFFFVAIIFIILAAFNFLFAKGNPEKITSARSQITWAVVAIVIALISVGAAAIIQSFIKIQ